MYSVTAVAHLRKLSRLFGSERVRAAWELFRFILVAVIGGGLMIAIVLLALAILGHAKRHGY